MNLVLERKQAETGGVDARGISYIKNNTKQASISVKAGELLNATITGITDKKISLQSGEIAFDAAAGSVKGEVGQEVTFQVLKRDGDGLVLKQVFSEQTTRESIKKRSFADIKELLKQNNLLSEETGVKQEDKLEEQIKIRNAAAKARRQLSYPAENAGLHAINELISSGLSLQKISLSILNSVMKEIDVTPKKKISEEELSALVDQYFEENGNGDTRSPEMIRALAVHDLPLTDTNMNSLEKTLRRADELQKLDNRTRAELIRKETPLTLESVYVARFSQSENSRQTSGKARGAFASESDPTESPLTEETWQTLLPDIRQALQREGMENTAETDQAARFLVENNCPVTRENIEKYHFLLQIETSLEPRDLMDAAIRNIQQDKAPTNILLYNRPDSAQVQQDALYQNYCDIIEVLPKATAEDISALLESGQDPTLDRIRNRVREQDLPAESGASISLPQKPAREESLSLITARRQLMEITLKLTYEAAYRLSQKNIQIDTAPLTQALESLKALEQERYESNLRAMGAVAGEADMVVKKAHMVDLYEKLSGLRPTPPQVFGDVLAKRADFTIQGVHASIQNHLSSYDDQHTPNAKYGDSFQKAASQFASLLKKLGMEPSEENIKAASILSQNNLDVTEENITKIKLMDHKLSELAVKLHPNIAAQMLKEGLNPIRMQIDHVLDYVQTFDQVYGNSFKDKISEHILELDENQSIDKNMRGSMTAVYRMLHMIDKNGGAALGFALRNQIGEGSEDAGRLTLGDLMEASKSYTKVKNGEGIDYTVDNGFGGLQRLVRPETNIRGILEKTSAEKPQVSDKAEYRNRLLASFGAKATPNNLGKLLAQCPDWENRSLEDLSGKLADLDKASNKKSLPREQAEFYAAKLQCLADVPPGVLEALRANDLQSTLLNILAMSNLIRRPSYLGEACDSLSRQPENTDLLEEIPDAGLKDFIEGRSPEDVLDGLTERLELLKEQTTGRDAIWELTLLQNALQIQNIQYRNGNGMRLPVRLRDRVGSLNLYVVNDKAKDDMKIFMSLDTKQLGQVQALITSDGSRAGIQISTESQKGAEALRQAVGQLDGYLAGSAMEVKELRVAVKGEDPAEPETTLKKANPSTGNLSFQNASTKEIKKLISALARIIDDAGQTA